MLQFHYIEGVVLLELCIFLKDVSEQMRSVSLGYQVGEERHRLAIRGATDFLATQGGRHDALCIRDMIRY